MRCVIDDTSHFSKSNAIPGIPAIVLKPPYKEKGDTFIHVAIESEVCDTHYLRHDEEWPESVYRRKIYKVRIPIERVTILKK